MSDWSAGYLTEIDYTHGYYRELSPAQLRIAALTRNIHLPNRPFRYLELGFGQGLSLNIHAATSPGQYWGTDFNPSQAANAQNLARASGSGVQALDLSFAELLERPDLPEFDVITLHGIWSWINDENRALLTDLFRRKLAVGGLLFISYNCYPGWAQTIPLRHLLSLHVDLAGSANDGIISKIDQSLKFVQSVIDAGGLYFTANPSAKDRLDTLQKMDRHYVAHEYFNRDWHPMPFSKVAEQLSEAKLSYVCSANHLDNLDFLNIAPKGLELLESIHHPTLRESVRDFMTNRQFRRDIFFKGPVPIPDAERDALMRQERFLLTVPPESVERRQLGTAGELTLPDAIYTPLLTILAQDDYAPKTLAEVEAHPLWPQFPFSILLQAITMLLGKHAVYAVQPPDIAASAQPYCQALKRHLLQKTEYTSDGGYLPSPLTGCGHYFGYYDLLFLYAYENGAKDAHAIAVMVWNILSRKGVVFNINGRPLITAEENVAQLQIHSQNFLVGTFLQLRRLGIVQE